MVDIRIDLGPDPERDAQARRAALALVTATLYDADTPGHRELSSVALNDLVEQVVGGIGEVREESVAALQHMLGVMARQYSAFATLSYAIASEAFAAGRRLPEGEEPDYGDVLSRVSRAIEGFPDTEE